MSEEVNKLSLYAAWEYDREEEALNEASQNGLQLVRGGNFISKFRKDTSVRYIYQLDYNQNIDNMARYRETFEDQGWEYINSTYNSWHYFRKPYEEGMDQQEASIYTDEQSIKEMQNRWLRFIIIFDIFYFYNGLAYLCDGIFGNSTIKLVEGIAWLFFGLTFLLGIINMVRKRNGKKGCFVPPMRLVLPIAFLFILLAIIPKVINIFI